MRCMHILAKLCSCFRRSFWQSLNSRDVLIRCGVGNVGAIGRWGCTVLKSAAQGELIAVHQRPLVFETEDSPFLWFIRYKNSKTREEQESREEEAGIRDGNEIFEEEMHESLI